MKTTLATLGTYLAAGALMVGTLVAQQTPTTITPASPQSGIAPNGIGATTSALLFSQPYCDSSSIVGSQVRGIYSATNLMNLASPPNGMESATIANMIPLPPENYCGGDENYFVISPGVGGFPEGSVYTAVVSRFAPPSTVDIYKDGAPTPISGISDPDQGHAGITFDTAGKFGNALILTTSTGIYGFDSTGTQTFHYPNPTTPAFYFLEGASVAPLSNLACPGCLYVTATNPGGAPGAILLVDPTTNPPHNTGTAPPTLVTEFPGLEPENIVFVSPTTCTLNGTDLSFFVSGYSTTFGSIPSTTGALFGFSQSQIATVANLALIPEEHGTIFVFDPVSRSITPFSTPTSQSGVYQLEGSALLGEASGACPKCNSSLQTVTYNVHENNSVNEIAWFNSHLTKLQGAIPTSTFQIFITGGKITFGPATIPVPDSVITFSSTAACSSTSFNTVLNRWEITIPLSAAGQADEIFAAGAAYLIPSGFPQNVNNVTWSANISSSAPGLEVTWQYGVSNWLTANKGSVFPTLSTSPFQADYNAMQVDPAHNAPLCSGNSGDHAGAPEFAGRNNVLTGGGSGGGGSNWTGSWSSTPKTVQVCSPQ